MAIPVEADVRKALKQYEPVLFKVVMNAWDKWWNDPKRHDCSFKRVRAALMHQYMMNEAKVLLAPMDGAHAIERHESIRFMLNTAVLARFKKGDQNGISKNIPTQSVFNFFSPQAPLFENVDLSKIEIVYVLNGIETKIQDVLIVARIGRKKIWDYSIYGAGGAEVANISTTPQNPPSADENMRIPGGKIQKEKGGSEE